jgi:hypothetical protein
MSGTILSVPDQEFDQIRGSSEQEPSPEGYEDSDEHHAYRVR